MNYFTLTLDNNQQLKIIVENEQKYIDLKDTLKILGKPFEWWETLTPEKIKRMKSKGFSGQTKPYSIVLPGGINKEKMIAYKDWLALTSYFASQRNNQAINLLTYFAEEGLENKLNQCS